MAGRIPQTFIDELMNRVDIVEVIDARVPLKKAGRDYSACCPFHSEKTPSFTVSQTKQFYHCFGCGAHGTALGFLMDYEHLGFVEAVEELAGTVGLEVPREAGTSPRPSGADELYAVMDRAAGFYRRALREHPKAGRAIDYLKGRGLTGEIAAEYGIGYAPRGWDNLLRALGAGPEAQRLLAKAGLVAEKEGGGAYDRFRDRIQFPIRDRRGRVVAFGGRILEGDGPKYLNSPETPIFHKGRELYGLYEARKALRKPERLLVVEGYMDVVALAQFGIRYAVATLGTATTAEHLETLYRVAPEVVFCFDGDRAGRDAAWRALENALAVLRDGRQARFLFLPEGEDPDSVVRQEGQAAFEARIADAIPLSEFFLEALRARADTATEEGRGRLAELARPLLARLPEGVFRQRLIERVAGAVHLPAERMGKLIGGPAGDSRRVPPPGAAARARRRSPARLAIALLLQHPGLARQVGDADTLKSLEVPGVDLLAQILEMLHREPHLTTGALLERWREAPEGKHLFKLARLELPGTEVSLAREFQDTVRHLAAKGRERRWEFLQEKLAREGLSESEKEEWKQLLSRQAPLPDAG
ncbi:MAG: DNA primase [Gammaproteobacteria bacterium]|nr:DNA primase [Gammaproteobacteria bacterium]NIR98629.1 DNA primase [Gammaproteobacteria bacterium]NIT64352.1 DNA primase [Gammaproteobacteria bacterium]NIV21276.1 DNA primase [Gammaproteobacteria bacterium]NIX10980.1 DNA primase [Gammaproteobacteria bacterium]